MNEFWGNTSLTPEPLTAARLEQMFEEFQRITADEPCHPVFVLTTDQFKRLDETGDIVYALTGRITTAEYEGFVKDALKETPDAPPMP